MNGGEGVNLGDYEPSWMTDGGGISGEQNQPDLDDYTPWDTTAWSKENPAPEDFIRGGECTPPGGDTSKIYFRATHYVDGQWVCYWVEETSCP